MIAAHDRFESLAGAIALGEATPAERAEFDAHASSCAACRDDAADAPVLAAAIADSRDAETWRPSLPIAERIRERANRRVRWQLGAFGWAVGASVVLNLALAGGVGSNFTNVCNHPNDGDAVVATRLTEDAPHVRDVADVPAASRAATIVKLPAKHAHRKPAAQSAPKPSVRPKPVSEPVADDIPNVLAGLDLEGSDGSGKRAVAVEMSPARCALGTPRDERACPTPDP